LRAIQILSQTCIDVCRGQALEAEVAGALETTEATYFEVIRLKTAGVFRAAAEIGATLGGGTRGEVDVLGVYGEALGMAFQVLDDVLEYTSQPETLGKPVDSDLRNERMTLPLIYALNAGPETRAAAVRLLRGGEYCALAEFLHESGMLAHAQHTAAGFAHTAREVLGSLPESEARSHLRKYTVDVLKRER
jgi:geranylgeranyl pyrophosphate synthase